MSEFFHGCWNELVWLIDLRKPDNLRAFVETYKDQWWICYAILIGIIFSETGLLIGFFLPGDSLLFAAGFLASQGVFDIGLLNLCLSAAAILGDALNYYVGLKMSDTVFEKGRLRFVKHSHLMAAKAFYERHGGLAIVLARFVPLVRTFTPFVAGIARMSYRRFVLFNILGGIGWVALMTLAGYFLGQVPWVSANFEPVVIGIVVLSVLPVVIGVGRGLMAKRRAAKETAD
jgi:membrane-associated protein